MSVLTPPPQDELELLIREARARQRKRWAGAAAFVAVVAGAVLAINSVAAGGSSGASQPGKGVIATRGKEKCGIRVAGPRILGSGGRTVYREPIPSGVVHPNSIPSQVRCSPSAIWVVWFNGVASSQEGYVGARSLDRGQTWKLVFAERYFGVNAPHQLDSYMGPWIVHGHAAYFLGSCPACSTRTSQGTISLWVTKDAGQTFRRYEVPALTGYGPTAIRVSGHDVTIRARRVVRKINSRPFEIYGHKTVTLHVG
jgi:hypothetical protein